uniref:Cytochrome c oxidase subunit 7A2 n=1 Tax=Monodelphis domestica TaxID=13616 RepID=A0A5F8GZ78_MONDO
MLRNFLALRQISQRTTNVAPVRQFKNKVPEKQKLFQEHFMPFINWAWLHFPRNRIDSSLPGNKLIQLHAAFQGT